MSIVFLAIMMVSFPSDTQSAMSCQCDCQENDSSGGGGSRCFDPLTTVELANSKMIAMEDLHLGDEIVSCRSPDEGNCVDPYLDTVTQVKIIEEGGPFCAHTLVFENKRQINVTSCTNTR